MAGDINAFILMPPAPLHPSVVPCPRVCSHQRRGGIVVQCHDGAAIGSVVIVLHLPLSGSANVRLLMTSPHSKAWMSSEKWMQIRRVLLTLTRVGTAS